MATKKKVVSKKPQAKKAPRALKVSGIEDLPGLVPIDLGAGLKIAQDTVKLTAKMAGNLDVLSGASCGTQNVLAAINVGLGRILPRILSALERIAAAQEKLAGIESRVVGHGEVQNEDGSISQDFTREMAPAALPEAPAFNGHGDVPPV